jgi:3-polyprenyl-4-hydroxybenzoate decarboxylase
MYIYSFPDASDLKNNENEKIFHFLTETPFNNEISSICTEIIDYHIEFKNDVQFLTYVMVKKNYNNFGNTIFYNRIIDFFKDRGYFITINDNEDNDLTMRVNISWF